VDLGHELEQLVHHVFALHLDLLLVLHAVRVYDVLRGLHQGVFRPGEKLVNGARGEQGGELDASLPELGVGG